MRSPQKFKTQPGKPEAWLCEIRGSPETIYVLDEAEVNYLTKASANQQQIQQGQQQQYATASSSTANIASNATSNAASRTLQKQTSRKMGNYLQTETYKYGLINSKEYFDNLLDGDSESSESSIDEDIDHQFDKMVDDAIETGSDEEEIKRVNKWVEQNWAKPKPRWYHMPDVSIPKLKPIVLTLTRSKQGDYCIKPELPRNEEMERMHNLHQSAE